MANSIELEGVTKRFGDKLAVDDLAIAVPEGSIYGFIGPNGSGKTTTLRLILRIYQPDAGRVTVLGADHGSVADDRVGYLPEERGLYKRMKVLDVIEYFARLKGAYNCRQAALEWLDRLDARSWAGKRVDTLSKGMAQKVQLIAAVVARPSIVILDEPFSGLDPVNLEMLKDAVLSLRDDGATIIFSTHDMHAAERLCDAILMIHEGRKVLDGSLQSIQNRYPVGSVKLRLADGESLPESLPEAESVRSESKNYMIHLAPGHTPQALLRRLAERSQIECFEVVRPSLHDIFVDIARPRQSTRETD